METISIGRGLDRISYLPSNVINLILCFLPFKDAVRTSALSKKWKEKWHTLPNIIVDEELFHRNYFRRLEGVINYILTKHEGRIEKFSVFVEVKDSFNVKSWLLRVAQKGIQELFLLYRRGRHNEVPSSTLFSLEHLRKLSLRRCVVNPPRSFRGFHCLFCLQLDKVRIETADFEKLISSCPLLEQLTLRKLTAYGSNYDSSCIEHLQIDAPKLKYLSFDGEFISMSLNTPFLEILSINLYRLERYDRQNQFDLRFQFCGLPSGIKELYVRCQFQKYLDACDRCIEVITYSNLRTLQLGEFCYENVEQVQDLLYLITSSGNLTTLDITACKCKSADVSEPFLKFWEEVNNAATLMLKQLKKVRVRSFHGNDQEMRLIQYVMANSPGLEEMTVEFIENSKFDEVKEVLQLCCKTSTQLSFIAGNQK
ncbi:F-box/RNI-like/FBD-like domains-containing protein [Euphorbia peplus]|nr:F-box/RNI-like/FBD-like domains-containing protein [Euphorbia peplus]